MSIITSKKVIVMLIIIIMLTMIATPSFAASKMSLSTLFSIFKKELKLNTTSVTLFVGKTEQLKATYGNKYSCKSVRPTYSSSDEDIVTIEKDGTITGKKAGTVTITAKYITKKATCKVTVKEEKLTLNKTDVTIDQSDTIKLKATYCEETVIPIYSSNKKDVATVKSDGTIKGKKAGTATITATYKGKTATCKVTVKSKITFHEKAAELKTKIAKDDVCYVQGTMDFSKTNPLKLNQVDCSSYVSWVIYEYGVANNISEYKENFKNSKNCSNMKTWFDNNTRSATYIGKLNKSTGTLKAGDILIKNGHVEIYSYTSNNNLYVFNCGTNNAINKEGAGIGATNANRSEYYVYRLTK